MAWGTVAALAFAALPSGGCAETLGIEEKHYEAGDASALEVDASVVVPHDAAAPDASDPPAPRGEDAGADTTADGASARAPAEASSPADASTPAEDDASPPPAGMDSGGSMPDPSPDATSAPPPDAASPPPDAGPPPNPLCAVPCQPANVVTVICIATICTYDQCAPLPKGSGTFLDCDGDRTNGCEASPDSPATCGSCTNTCRAGHACSARADGTFACKGQPGN